MVNMDKWEKVEYHDLKVGDRMKRLNIHDDGTRAVVKGKIAIVTNYGLSSKGKFILAKPFYNFPTELYRRKPKTVTPPENAGAVVKATMIEKGTRHTFICGGQDWNEKDINYSHYSTNFLQKFYTDFDVLSEGVKL